MAVVVAVGNGSSWVYMSVHNTGKGSAGYVTIVFSDAGTRKNYNECCVGKDRWEAENVRSPDVRQFLKLMSFRLSRYKRVGNIQMVTFLKRTPIFFFSSTAGKIARLDGCGGRILSGYDTGGWAVLKMPVQVPVSWFSPYVQPFTTGAKSDLTRTFRS